MRTSTLEAAAAATTATAGVDAAAGALAVLLAVRQARYYTFKNSLMDSIQF